MEIEKERGKEKGRERRGEEERGREKGRERRGEGERKGERAGERKEGYSGREKVALFLSLIVLI